RIVRRGSDRVRAFESRQGEGHSPATPRGFERRPDFRIAFRGAESHNEISGSEYRIEPGTKLDGQIERRQGTFANDDGVNEFDRDVLRVGGVRSAPKCEQPAAPLEAFRHLTAGRGQTKSFTRKKCFDDLVAHQ